MTTFVATTGFRLVRRIAAAGPENPAMYLLIAKPAEMGSVKLDLAEEVDVQLGLKLRSFAAGNLPPERLEDVFKPDPVSPVVLITLDNWMPKLVKNIDRNIVLLTRAGPVLLLANPEVAERVLVAAPNLRNRLTDILAIYPDEAFGGTPP